MRDESDLQYGDELGFDTKKIVFGLRTQINCFTYSHGLLEKILDSI